MNYYIRTKYGGFNDDMHQFTEEWTKVPETRFRGEYFDNPKLEVLNEKEHAKKVAKET